MHRCYIVTPRAPYSRFQTRHALGPRPRESEVGASLRLLSSGRGVAETAPGETDYCSSVSVSASVTAVVVVGVSASVSSESLFSLSSGSMVLSGALGVAVR